MSQLLQLVVATSIGFDVGLEVLPEQGEWPG